MPEEPLLDALAEAARRLEAGDAEGAAQALASTGALCDPTATRPSSAAIREARRLLERCFSAESRLRHQVVSGLEHLAAGRRVDVYRYGATRR